MQFLSSSHHYFSLGHLPFYSFFFLKCNSAPENVEKRSNSWHLKMPLISTKLIKTIRKNYYESQCFEQYGHCLNAHKKQITKNGRNCSKVPKLFAFLQTLSATTNNTFCDNNDGFFARHVNSLMTRLLICTRWTDDRSSTTD